MEIHQDPVPLQKWDDGSIRIGGTRIHFYLVVGAYKLGAPPEKIANDMYLGLELADAYAVVAYYLRHKEEVDAYLKQIEEESQELRRKIEEVQGKQPGNLRE